MCCQKSDIWTRPKFVCPENPTRGVTCKVWSRGGLRPSNPLHFFHSQSLAAFMNTTALRETTFCTIAVLGPHEHPQHPTPWGPWNYSHHPSPRLSLTLADWWPRSPLALDLPSTSAEWWSRSLLKISFNKAKWWPNLTFTFGERIFTHSQHLACVIGQMGFLMKSGG